MHGDTNVNLTMCVDTECRTDNDRPNLVYLCIDRSIYGHVQRYIRALECRAGVPEIVVIGSQQTQSVFDPRQELSIFIDSHPPEFDRHIVEEETGYKRKKGKSKKYNPTMLERLQQSNKRRGI